MYRQDEVEGRARASSAFARLPELAKPDSPERSTASRILLPVDPKKAMGGLCVSFAWKPPHKAAMATAFL